MTELDPRQRGVEHVEHAFSEPESTLTPEMLLNDNQSELAQANIAEFNQNKASNQLVYGDFCSDARQTTLHPDRTYSDRRIGAAIKPKIASRILNSNRVHWGFVSGHYDSILSKNGEIPVGCGGLGAKAEIVRNGTTGSHKDPLYEFIDENLSEDQIANSFDYARELIALAEDGKKVLVAPQDHRTGQMKPIMWFEKRNGLVANYFPPELKMPTHGRFNPKELYANGMPSMDLGKLPDEMAEYLEEYEKQRVKLYKENPWLVDEKETQNPSILVFSTDLRDPQVWLPHMFQFPNTGFRLTVPRQRIEETVEISERDKYVAFSQASYVLGHNVENAERPDAPFHSTNTIIAFKADFNRAVEFVEDLTAFEQQYAASHGRAMWHSFPNRQIIVGETNRGTITRIGQIDFEVSDGRVVNFEPREIPFTPQKAS